MALTPQKVDDIKENFKAIFSHPKFKPEEVEISSKEEYLELLQSKYRVKPTAVALRHARPGTYVAYRYYYRFAMYEIRIKLLQYFRTISPRPRIPAAGKRTPRNVVKHVNNRIDFDKDITMLEHCLVDGVQIFAFEILTTAQAIYVFGCMQEGSPIDHKLFDLYATQGVHKDALPDESPDVIPFPTTEDTEDNSFLRTEPYEPSPLSTTELDESPKPLSRFKHSGSSISLPPTVGEPRPFSTTERGSTCPLSTTELHNDLLPIIHAGVQDIKSLLPIGGSPDFDVLEDKFVHVLVNALEETRNRFEKGILLNAKGEEFMIMLHGFIDAFLAEPKNGNNKSEAYRQCHEAMNISSSHFSTLRLAFTKCKLGEAKGNDVTVTDVENYYRKFYRIVEVPSLADANVIEKRVLKIY